MAIHYYICDFPYVASVIVLLIAKALLMRSIWKSKDCSGISKKTQVLYIVVLSTRLTELLISVYFTHLPSPPPIILAATALILTCGVMLSIYFANIESYEQQYDTYRVKRLILPCAVLAVLVDENVFWAFASYLEVVAIIPQFDFIKKAKYLRKSVRNYLCLLAIYKFLCVMDELNHRFHNYWHYNATTLATGLVQLMLYCDFFLRKQWEPEQEGDGDMEKRVSAKEAEARRSAAGEYAADGRFADNLKEVVLTPALFVQKDDKIDVTLSTVQEGKCTNGNLPEVHNFKTIYQ